jgi:hypothetical protein
LSDLLERLPRLLVHHVVEKGDRAIEGGAKARIAGNTEVHDPKAVAHVVAELASALTTENVPPRAETMRAIVAPTTNRTVRRKNAPDMLKTMNVLCSCSCEPLARGDIAC